MTNEKLKKAKELEKEIGDLEYAIDRLHNGHEIAICFYFDSNYGNSCYKKLYKLSENEVIDIKANLQIKLQELEKEFEAL